MTDREKIREDIERLQNSINECIDDLAIARDRKDDGEELIALRRMEALLGDVKQTCTSVLNSLKEEPVSEELKVELEKYIKDHFTIDTEQLDRFGIEEKDYMYSMDKSDILALVEHFAKWQKQQFEKNRLKHCNSITNEQAELEQCFIDQHLGKYQRMPTFLDAIEYGIMLQKEQMMKDAKSGIGNYDNYIKFEDGTWIDLDPSMQLKPAFNVNVNDKVKVIVTKEG